MIWLEEAINENTCAIMLEPIQGEVVSIRLLMNTCKQYVNYVIKGIILIFDEVQCGLGRTGKLFGYRTTV